MSTTPADFGCTTRPGKDGRLELVHKDDAGKEYVALKCAGPEFTEDDAALLRATDRDRSSPREATEYMTAQSERRWQDWESRLNEELLEETEPLARDLRQHAFENGDFAFIKPQTGAGPGQMLKGESGHVLPRRQRYVMRDDGTLELVEELLYN